jgi:hypothetical protein
MPIFLKNKIVSRGLVFLTIGELGGTLSKDSKKSSEENNHRNKWWSVAISFLNSIFKKNQQQILEPNAPASIQDLDENISQTKENISFYLLRIENEIKISYVNDKFKLKILGHRLEQINLIFPRISDLNELDKLIRDFQYLEFHLSKRNKEQAYESVFDKLQEILDRLARIQKKEVNLTVAKLLENPLFEKIQDSEENKDSEDSEENKIVEKDYVPSFEEDLSQYMLIRPLAIPKINIKQEKLVPKQEKLVPKQEKLVPINPLDEDLRQYMLTRPKKQKS